MFIKTLCVLKKGRLPKIRIVAFGDNIPTHIVVLMADYLKKDFPDLDLKKVEVVIASNFKELSFFYGGDIPKEYEKITIEELKYAPSV
ncbi:hypothetical protein KC850_01205 [Candidatus Kaiserbacteria bacterium]|nr:hypothetical protein [Candidatus Kaiserbacteria bacterium]MCB9817900.1 hypothetical protein [Candidatus Nomurabacteria bacterium]